MRQVENTTESIQTAKLSSVVRFSSNLRQLTICPILLCDLEKIDFVKIQVTLRLFLKNKLEIRTKWRGSQTVHSKTFNASPTG